MTVAQQKVFILENSSAFNTLPANSGINSAISSTRRGVGGSRNNSNKNLGTKKLSHRPGITSSPSNKHLDTIEVKFSFEPKF
jgi:hypothetical protein